VLEEVSCTVVLGGFVSGPGIDPNPDSGGFAAGYGFGRDAEAGFEGGNVGGGGAEDVVGKRRGGGCRCRGFGGEGTAGRGGEAVPLGLLP